MANAVLFLDQMVRLTVCPQFAGHNCALWINRWQSWKFKNVPTCIAHAWYNYSSDVLSAVTLVHIMSAACARAETGHLLQRASNFSLYCISKAEEVKYDNKICTHMVSVKSSLVRGLAMDHLFSTLLTSTWFTAERVFFFFAFSRHSNFFFSALYFFF